MQGKMSWGKIIKKILVVIGLAVTLSLSALCGTASAAESWAQRSLDKVVNWGVMKGYSDGKLHENKSITRAEFVAMVNRAFGYTEVGKIPFTDIKPSAWSYDDIAIAYNAGIFDGTSAATASPNGTLTREQAVVLIARNLRLDETVGEITAFSDGRSFENWSHGYVNAAVQKGLISGYSDGSFHPQNNITRGEAAKMLTNVIGTLIHDKGTYSLGGVFGNVMINTSGATLKNTTIAGDLYLCGGLGLGDITLENVDVSGQIIVAGGGESAKGNNSVILRNVVAKGLVVDNAVSKKVSVSAEGKTAIPTASLRSNCYLQDLTSSKYGINTIYLDGASGSAYTLSGSLQDIVNRSAGSKLQLSQGWADSVTIDEKATDSALDIAVNTNVDTLNLDVGTTVTGVGDIETINVDAANSKVSMLPESIVIRPGLTAVIAGETMDTKAGQESSSDPKLLTGYPKAADIAPTSMIVSFQTNKSSTVYWVVSPYSAGSPSAASIISPPTYSASILKAGNQKIAASGTTYTSKVTGLSSGGEYCLSAVLIDARGWQSAVKTIYFETPDDSTPAFAAGYPYMSLITNKDAQVAVMTTKSCRMYYALLAKGSAAPAANEFRNGAISGSYGTAAVTVTKNTVATIDVNSTSLSELAPYDLYLWLTDTDGAKSSSVIKLSFTTADKTPPVFNYGLTVNSVKETSLGFLCNLNETGTVYWVAVKDGTEYPEAPAGSTGELLWTDNYAKLQVSSGMNGLKSGKVSVKPNADAAITISGLASESAYDVYYVAIDQAGNYSSSIYKVSANTLDTSAPTVSQTFTRFSGNETGMPYANTDVQIIFSENVQRASTNEILLSLYENVKKADTANLVAAKGTLAAALRATVELYSVSGSSQPVRVKERTSSSDPVWAIDYRNAVVERKDGKLVITLATADSSEESALNLNSGSTYFFRIEDIADTSTSKNLMGVTSLNKFTTISSQAALNEDVNISNIAVGSGNAPESDMAFSLTPLSTSKSDENTSWDMILWFDTSVEFTLYQRVRGDAVWSRIGSTSITVIDSGDGMIGCSLVKALQSQVQFPALNTLNEDKVYEYAIHFDKVEGESDRTSFSQLVNCKVDVVTGSNSALSNLSANVTEAIMERMVSAAQITRIEVSTLGMYKQFQDGVAPSLTGGYPIFSVSDTKAEMSLLLSRSGTVYYVIAPEGEVISKKGVDPVTFPEVPESGSEQPFVVTQPTYLDIVSPNYSGNANILTGHADMGTGARNISIDGLLPSTKYYVYLVTKGIGQVFSDVYLYRMTTPAITRPVITLSLDSTTVSARSDLTTELNYIVVPYNNNISGLFSEDFAGSAAVDTLPAAYQGLSVLQAMSTDVQQSGVCVGSVFDLYATQAYKDRVAQYIRTTSSSGGTAIAGSGSETLKPNTWFQIDCRALSLSQSTQYCFLAVGKSTLGSGDAFRGIYPMSVSDTQWPLIVDLNSTVTIDSATGRASGEISLIFSEELYSYQGTDASGVPQLLTVDRGPILRGSGDSSKYISIASLVSTQSTGMSVVTNDTLKGKNTTVIDLSVTNVTNGASITFDPSLSDQYSNRAAKPLNVKISIVSGTVQALVTTQWDGR